MRGVNVHLYAAEIVGRDEAFLGNLFLKQLVDAVHAIGRFPARRHGVGIVVGNHARVGGGDESRRRIVDMGKLIEGDVALPVVGGLVAAQRKPAVALGTNRDQARAVISNVAGRIGVDEVLGGAGIFV